MIGNLENLNLISRIKFDLSSSFIARGEKLQVAVISVEEIRDDIQLVCEIFSISEEKNVLSLKISSLHEKFILDIPVDLQVGDYEVQLRLEDLILDSIPLYIGETEFVDRATIFEKGLELRIQVMKLIESYEYKKAFSVNQSATKKYQQIGSDDIAATAWKDLGINFLDAHQFNFARKAFRESNKLFKFIKDEQGQAVSSHLLSTTCEKLLETTGIPLIEDPHKRPILIVEDEIAIGKTLQEFLMRTGYSEVKLALNGEEALEKMTKIEFYLTLLDYRMPILNGMDVVSRLATRGNVHPSMGLAMITGHSQAFSEQDFMHTKNNNLIPLEVMSKPVNPNQIVTKIDDWLNRVHDERESQVA